MRREEKKRKGKAEKGEGGGGRLDIAVCNNVLR